MDKNKTLSGKSFDYVKYFFPDYNGQLRQVEVRVGKTAKLEPILFDGSSVPGYGRTEKSDRWLVPSISTLQQDYLETTEETKVGYVFCDVRKKVDELYDGCPRSMLKKEVAELKKKYGYDFYLGLEPEFFLFKRDDFYNHGVIVTIDHDSYFSYSESAKSELLIREMSTTLEKYGFEIEKLSHEVSAGQFEVNYKYLKVLEGCDKFMLMKYVCKKIASRKGYIASFMPKPMAGVNGNGLHTNISIFKNNKNLYALSTREDYQKWSINGILSHGKALSAFTNGSVNSFNRLTKGFEAPIYLSYSRSNRSTMIRIPLNSTNETSRIEVRNVDASSNIYIMIYSLIKAMIWGINNKIETFQESTDNLFKITSDNAQKMHLDYLPQSLTEAIHHLKKNSLVRSWFSEDFFNNYRHLKFVEWTEFKKHVTPWEQKRYINL